MSAFPAAFGVLLSAMGGWLPDMDLNHVFQCFRHCS